MQMTLSQVFDATAARGATRYRVVTALAARWRVLAVTCAICALVTLGLSLLVPRSYLAEVSLVLDSKGTDPITGTIVPAQLLPGFLPTQLEVIASHSTAVKVVDKLNLTSQSSWRAKFTAATDGVGSLRDFIADQLLEKLMVLPSKDSDVVRILFPDTDPGAAARFANTFAAAYIQTSLDLKADPSRQQSRWFEVQVLSLKNAVEAAQRRLSEFQRASGIVGTDDRLDTENAKLTELATQLVATQADMFQAQSHLTQMRRAVHEDRLRESPDIVSDTVLQGLQSDLAHVEANLAQVSQRYDRNHPQYLAAAAQVTSLREKLQAEREVVRGSVQQQAQIAQQRVTDLQRAVEQQKQRILHLKLQHDQLDALQREVQSARRAYDAASQRSGDLHLESRLDAANIAVLSPAAAPTRPSRPRLLLNLALGVGVGLTLGAGLALLQEAQDKRIRSLSDLQLYPGLELIAAVPGLLGKVAAERSATTLPPVACSPG